jgi:hypothetical protein
MFPSWSPIKYKKTPPKWWEEVAERLYHSLVEKGAVEKQR